MSKYIDREAFKDKYLCCGYLPEMSEEEFDKFPAAVVASVVHGKWMWADDGYCRCSSCTQKAPLIRTLDDEPEVFSTNYCPNCGAKMDGRQA